MAEKENKKQPLVILTGPTAVGKTALSLRLAKAADGEIISADSMQVYRGLDIGSAKILPEQMEGVTHHLIDVLDPKEPFDVVRFQSMAKECIADIAGRGHLPILTGGTGFYIQSVLYDIDFTETQEDPDYRRYLEEYADANGDEALHALLAAADPESARQIHPHNRRRTIRALEFHRSSGALISEHNERERAKTSPFSFAYFVLDDDREALYGRCDERVDRMLEDGLEEEVRGLKALGLTREDGSMKGIGYREMLGFLEGETDREETVRLIKRNTRHFAKRQLTWFRRERDVIRLYRPDFASEDDILAYMLKILREKEILTQ